jgi:uncharacterized membrane protein HdeD (DUF308 family)
MTTDVQLDINAKKATGWVIALSIGLMILGLLAIFLPTIASAFFTAAIGWTALVGGVVMIIEAFQSRALRSVWLNLMVGIFYVIAGIYILANLRAALLALTFAFSILFIVEGIYTIIMAFVNRAGHRMSWVVALNGVVTLILGIMVLNRFPASAFWLIGLYVGISLFMRGLSLLIAATVVRRSIARSV